MATGNGAVSEKWGEIEVEWTVKDVCSYSVQNECVSSRYFTVSGIRWCLKIYPCGKKGYEGWICLYLVIGDDCDPPKSVDFALGRKKSDGMVDYSRQLCYFFYEQGNGYGLHSFLKTSDLLKRKSELAPSGDLTVTCKMRVNARKDSTARLDMPEKLKDLFVSERGCDVTLNVQGDKISAHKSILSAQSPVFATMFDIEMKEKTTGVVNIEDCHPEPFKDFLMYLYSGNLENLSKSTLDLYRIAEKYDVPPLMEACVSSMISNLSVENMGDAYILADQFSDEYLKTEIQEFFKKNFSKIVISSQWESFLKANCFLVNELLKSMTAEKK